MLSRWENEHATSLYIPSHTAVITLSAANVRQHRGRHHKNSGKEALWPSLGVKPVILYLKWSCKRSQVVVQWDSSAKQMIWWSSAISRCRHAAVFGACREIFNDDWARPPDEKLIHCRKHNCTLVSSISAKLCDSLPSNKINEADVDEAELKFKTRCCLEVIYICRYLWRQHHCIIWPVWRYLPFPKFRMGTKWLLEFNSSECGQY